MAEIDLTSLFPNLKPIKSPPAMMRLNGCGTGVYGRRDYDASTGTYITTLCVSLLFLPVVCLRAYRVAKADRGWYFIGREPLSPFAKRWNVFLLLGVLSAVGIVQYTTYTSSPPYKARQQMAAAHKHAGEGRLAEAARTYQALASAGADESENAVKALSGLLDNECQNAALSESAGVFAAAAQVARRGNSIAVPDVADKGLKLVQAKGDTDPRGGIAMLDVVRPLMMDTRPIDAQRFKLLQKWAAAEPASLDAVVPLAALLEKQDKLDDAKKLLLPFKDKFGDGEGACVLGQVLGRQGDYDGAYALLWPYVKSRLDRLHAAEKAQEQAVDGIEHREIGKLKDNQGPSDFYNKYNAAGEAEQKTMVRQYINERIKNDPQFTQAQEDLERETAVVPVALELGIVMTQRAQAQAKPDARKSQLESAEQVFLAIGGVAGETDEYRLSLGQVYYWLGKQAEGHKLFDDFLSANGRKFEDLLKIAMRLRAVGDVPEARAMAEEAYNKTSRSEEQHRAASFRALCFNDLDDQIAWLNRADLADPVTKASLAKALGAKAFEEGRDDEASRQYHICIDAYDAMPRTASTVNERALAYYGIFQATGDRQALDRCLDSFQQAVDLEPGDPILLYNAGITLLEGALADVIGNDIDLRALHESGSTSTLGYLYRDQAGRDIFVKRVKEHPGIARALSYLEKVAVLSPKDSKAFDALYSIHQFTHDEAALRALEPRIRAADIDVSDQLTHAREYLSGARDAQSLVALNAAIKRGDDMDAALRAKGARTAAVAIDEQAGQLMTLDVFTNNVDADKVVALAEEAQRLDPSSNTDGMLMTARLFRAARDLRHADPDFDAYYGKYKRSLGVTYLIATAALDPGPFQHKVLQNSDVQQAIGSIHEDSRRFPDGRSPYDWALLKNADPAGAEQAARIIRGIPRKAVERSITSLLRPVSASEAMDSSWLLRIEGKPDDANTVLQKVAAMGIPLPGQP